MDEQDLENILNSLSVESADLMRPLLFHLKGPNGVFDQITTLQAAYDQAKAADDQTNLKLSKLEVRLIEIESTLKKLNPPV